MARTTTTRTTTTRTAAPTPAADPIAALLAQALAATAQAQGKGKRQTSNTQRETLAQDLTPRDTAALARMGWDGRLSSAKPAEPAPKAKVKAGPVIGANFADLTPERQASVRFWAGLCAVLRQNKGRVWLPEAAAVAAAVGIDLKSPTQLATRLAALTGCPVSRPADQAGWLVCPAIADLDPQPAEALWIQLWNLTAQTFADQVAAES
jgi:hypothetical protein